MKHMMIRRFLAYILDIFLVACVMYFISFIPLSRENQKNYEEISAQINALYDSFRYNEISEEQFNEEYIPLYYEWSRSNMGNTIINLFLIVLYFGCVPYFMKGQTVGKKLFRLKIVSTDEKDSVGIVSFLVRAIILNNIFITIAQLGILSFGTVDNYYSMYSNVNLVGYVLLYFMVLLVFLRSDSRGLHDMIAGTKVISVMDVEEVENVSEKSEDKKEELAKSSHEKKIVAQPKKNSVKKKPVSNSKKDVSAPKKKTTKSKKASGTKIQPKKKSTN